MYYDSLITVAQEIHYTKFSFLLLIDSTSTPLSNKFGDNKTNAIASTFLLHNLRNKKSNTTLSVFTRVAKNIYDAFFEIL